MEAGSQEDGDCRGHEETGNVFGLSRTVVAEMQRMLDSIWEAIC